MKIIIIAVASLVAACTTSTGIIPANNGTYLIAKKSPQLGISEPVGIKGEAYQEANEFCAKDNKSVETVQYSGQGSHIGRFASVSLEFKCVAKTQQ